MRFRVKAKKAGSAGQRYVTRHVRRPQSGYEIGRYLDEGGHWAPLRVKAENTPN